MKPICIALLLSCLSLFGCISSRPSARAAPAIENFTLRDEAGHSHSLFLTNSPKWIVVVGHTEGCPILEKSFVKLKNLRERFGRRGVEFLFLNASPQDDIETLSTGAKTFAHQIPILKDETHKVVRQLGLTRSAEAVVIDSRQRKIAYRGPIDDQYDYAGEKFERVNPFLAEALEALLTGRPVKVTEREAKGCLIGE